MSIQFSVCEEVRAAAPLFRELIVEAKVSNPPTCDELWAEIEAEANKLRETLAMEQVRLRPAIDATRRVYKALGKEPNRYRPSAEALTRRCVKGVELYRTLTIIDLINLMSLITGHSIGGFDADKVVGNICLGVGCEGEPYEAIGRGPLNIHCLPVIRDEIGGIGTPTSDNERTKLSEQTTRLLMTINMYDGGNVEAVESLTRRLLTQYASATDINFTLY